MSRLYALVLDDSEDYQRIIGRVLKPAGFKVLAARSAEEALIALETQLPDVVIVDWNLPGADGFEFARRVRSNPRLARLLLVMLTVNAEVENQVRGLREGGFDAFLGKPFAADEFLARILALLKRREELEKQKT